jgi:histidinol-phosphate phosphatase family protein
LKAVFLDRDGVLNRERDSYIRTLEMFELLPGAAEAVASLNRRGFAVFVVTNQSGIARGYLTLDTLEAMHRVLRSAVQAAGGAISGIYFCPHHPDEGCVCRKPSPYLVRKAAAEHGIDLGASFFVGDTAIDVACGRAAGCRTILALSGKTTREMLETFPVQPDHVCEDLAAAVEWITARDAAGGSETP